MLIRLILRKGRHPPLPVGYREIIAVFRKVEKVCFLFLFDNHYYQSLARPLCQDKLQVSRFFNPPFSWAISGTFSTPRNRKGRSTRNYLGFLFLQPAWKEHAVWRLARLARMHAWMAEGFWCCIRIHKLLWKSEYPRKTRKTKEGFRLGKTIEDVVVSPCLPVFRKGWPLIVVPARRVGT